MQKGGSACPQDDGIGSMAQISGGKAAWHSQRVEDNAFHLCSGNDECPRLLAARLYGGDFGEIWWEMVGGECLDIHFD